jgi:predicted HAD superfamily phosphohydrolase YqeG
MTMTIDLTQYKLIICDLDDTLVPRYGNYLLPGVTNFLRSIPKETKLAIATNKGNVGLYWWMVETGWGTPDDSPQLPNEAETQIETVRANAEEIAGREITVYKCFAFISSEGNIGPIPLVAQESMTSDQVPFEWDINNRKPEPGMLLRAMEDAQASPDETLFIGDRDTDEQAAMDAGCHFSHVDSIMPLYKDNLTVVYNPNKLTDIYRTATQGNGPDLIIPASFDSFESLVRYKADGYDAIGAVEFKRDYQWEKEAPSLSSEGDDIDPETLAGLQRKIFFIVYELEWATFKSAEAHLAALEAAKLTPIGQAWVNRQAIMFGRLAELRYAACESGDAAYDDYSEKGAEIFRSMPDLRVLSLRDELKSAFHAFLDILTDIKTHNPDADMLRTGNRAKDTAYNNLVELAAGMGGDELATALESRIAQINAIEDDNDEAITLDDARKMVAEAGTPFNYTIKQTAYSIMMNFDNAGEYHQVMLRLRYYQGMYGKSAILGLRIAQLMGRQEDVAHDYWTNPNNVGFEPRTKNLAE